MVVGVLILKAESVCDCSSQWRFKYLGPGGSDSLWEQGLGLGSAAPAGGEKSKKGRRELRVMCCVSSPTSS